jgi:hypothetical protein
VGAAVDSDDIAAIVDLQGLRASGAGNIDLREVAAAAAQKSVAHAAAVVEPADDLTGGVDTAYIHEVSTFIGAEEVQELTFLRDQNKALIKLVGELKAHVRRLERQLRKRPRR